ncbi:Double stranded RNA binding [Echinococcus multilocularis]|uniref:Double stranded RNA binding n=1 Tax=Echinococcus multilocularis TaxID=6211 RepID=A0A068YCZ4_ECHMU|nr:Double stranded RNA binding [Echinococcus multilocularis]
MASLTNPISSLRSYCRIEGLQFHQRVIDETGLPHERLFHVQTIVTRQQNSIIPNLFDGFGHSIKVAKRNSALTALSSLNQQNELPIDASPRQDGLESILRLFAAELLPSKHSYADLVKLGRLFKVPIRLFKSGLDHCVSFCECKFLSPLGYQEASFKALSAIRALVEKMDEICIQSFVWKVDLLARLRGFSVSYEVMNLTLASQMKHVSKSQFSASCVLFPLTKTEASAKCVKRAKELAARLMLGKFKSGDITRCSPLQNSIKPPTANRRGDNDASRGDLTYTGSLHPVERLELNQRISDEPPPVYTVEKLSPIPASLSYRSGRTNKANHRSVKFRYFCRLGEMVIRGAACDNKRLAKRSAAERALQAIGISPYPHLAQSAVSPPPALHRSAPDVFQSSSAALVWLPMHETLGMLYTVGRQQEKIEDSLVTFSCAEEIFIFKAATLLNVKSHFKSSKGRSRSTLRNVSLHSSTKSGRRCRSVGIDTFGCGLQQLGNMDTTSKYHIGTTKLNKENCLNWKSEEHRLPSPRQEAVAWQLLSQLIRVLAFQRPNDSFSATAEFVSPDTQLLQMCNRFGIPCKLTELPGFKFTGGGAPVFQTRKSHNFVGLGCAFLLQIGGNHLGSLCLPSATGTEWGYWTSSRGPIRLECQHNGRGGCFLSTASNRETCRRSLALYVLRGLPDLSK